jgi:hypothetical protein
MTLHATKKDYLQQIKDDDCKYFVLKADDLLESLETWDQFFAFQALLARYNEYRQQKKAKSPNKYFVANRDEFPKIKNGEEYIALLRNAYQKL